MHLPARQTCTGTRTANHSLNGVISDKYEAIITADVFLDHNYLLVLQREHSEAVPPPDGADMPQSLSLLSLLHSLFSGLRWKIDRCGAFRPFLEIDRKVGD